MINEKDEEVDLQLIRLPAQVGYKTIDGKEDIIRLQKIFFNIIGFLSNGELYKMPDFCIFSSITGEKLSLAEFYRRAKINDKDRDLYFKNKFGQFQKIYLYNAEIQYFNWPERCTFFEKDFIITW